MNIPDWTWLLFAYVVGSFSTWFLFWGSLRHQTIEDTIDLTGDEQVAVTSPEGEEDLMALASQVRGS